MSTKITGPMSPHHVATIDGYAVPFVKLHKLDGKDDGLFNVCLDDRFVTLADQEEIQRWLPMLAHALAIGSGFSCHGENSVPHNRFNCKVMQIGSVDTEPGEQE